MVKKYGVSPSSGASRSRDIGDFQQLHDSQKGAKVNAYVSAVNARDSLPDVERGRSIPLNAIEVETTWSSHSWCLRDFWGLGVGGERLTLFLGVWGGEMGKQWI